MRGGKQCRAPLAELRREAHRRRPGEGRSALAALALVGLASACGPADPGGPAAEPPPSSPSAAIDSRPRMCVGEEPFWLLSLDGAGAVFDEPAKKGATLKLAGGFAGDARQPDATLWRGAGEGGAPAVAVVMTRARCEAASGAEAGERASVTLGEGPAWTGCCFIRERPAGAG